ncbi:MAG: hypothetical protein HKN49_13765 [Gammaproteobacteria bacterium]|nr:hypothetical protein [Gammaproteobacteria bacterium]
MISRYFPLITAAVLVTACDSGGSPAVNAVVPDSCSTVEQNRFVLDVMRDIYYWVDEMPGADPAAFDSPEALLDFLLFDELDRFSAIADAAEEDAFFSSSQFIGVGLSIQAIGDRLFVTQTFSDGPAAAAGLARGYELLSINGLDAAEIINGDGISAAFGADEVGTQVDLVYLDRAGTQMSATIFKAIVTIDTVSAAAVLPVANKTVGYVAFRNFVEPSFAALDNVFSDFKTQGVDELVLDLRYNSGGLISVAEFLAGLVGGTVTDGEIFAVRTHNSQNTFRNRETRFLDESNALDLRRVIIITSGRTASASEMVINGLEPFLDVVLIGEQTLGKPVGSYGFAFCDKIARPIAFANENAIGDGDFFGGLAVDCEAADDLDFDLGDPEEASLAEALYYIANGSCSVQSARSQKATTTLRRLRSDYDLLNAY